LQRTFNYSCILLAAGESVRMGVNKILLPFRGRTIIEHISELFDFPEIRDRLIVTGHLADAIKKMPAFSGWRIIINPRPQEGMGLSLKMGLEKIHPASQGVFIAHGDMPLVRKDTMAQLMYAFTPGSILLPRYRAQRGHPVLIDKSLAEQCLWLDHDRPLKEMIYQNESSIKYVDVDDAGILADMDTPEDYEKIKNL